MKRLFKSLRYDLLNLLGILAVLAGVMAMGGVCLSVSATLYRLPLAGAFFFAGWQLLVAGLSRPRRAAQRRPRRSPQLPDGRPVVRRAA